MSRPNGATVQPGTSFNALIDAQLLKKALKEKNAKEIIGILAYRSNSQRQDIKVQYEKLFGSNVVKDAEDQLSFRFGQVCSSLLMSLPAFLADEIQGAVSASPPDNGTLIEILCTNSNRVIAGINKAYREKYSRRLDEVILQATGPEFRYLFEALCTGVRDENQNVENELAKQDAQALHRAGDKCRWDMSNADVFGQIMIRRSRMHLLAVNIHYKAITGFTMEQAISKELPKNLSETLLSIFDATANKERFLAKRLHWSMKGIGTHDSALIRLIVSRCEIDMRDIMSQFQQEYTKPLGSWIADDTSGDYANVLLSLIRST